MLTEQQQQEVYDCFENGLSTEDIADLLNLDECEVQDYFEENF